MEDGTSTRCSFTVFPTEFGWFGMLGRGEAIHGLTIGHATADEVRRALVERMSADDVEIDFEDSDWNPQLRRRLENYALGHRDDFAAVTVSLPPMTPFQTQIIKATRNIGYAETLSYAGIATKAGSPRAARAVGNVMASNRIPIIIPCHRVIASGGRFGGFSAPQGVDLKIRMLALEAESVAD